MRIWRAALWLLTLTTALAWPARAATAQDDALQHEVEVPLHDGQVELAELVRALLRSYELDVDALDVRSRTVDLRGVRGQLVLYGCRKLLFDTVRFRKSLDGEVLTVTVDRARARDVRRALRGRLARVVARLTGGDLEAGSYVLAMPERLDPARPLVVLVHGVESGPEIWDDLRAHLQAHGLQTATFAYPNDGACERAAVEFAKALRGLGAQPVRLVAHSMGGLVARAVVEDPALDPGNVEVLVMLGTPNHGSNLAGLRFALEAADLLRAADGADRFGHALVAGLRANLADGLGEAGGDLLPGSVFLERLAARSRNPRVSYHLVLGTRSVFDPAGLDAVRARARRLLGQAEVLRPVRSKLEAWLDDLPELVEGAGDGVVAVARGRLDGVDAVLVPLDHVGLVRLHGLLGGATNAAAHPVFAAVLAWVAASR